MVRMCFHLFGNLDDNGSRVIGGGTTCMQYRSEINGGAYC